MKTKKDKTTEVFKEEIVGDISIDAGICWIGDPCYIMHTDKFPTKALGNNWEEFCDKLGKLPKLFKHDNGIEGLGVCVSTGYGDGFYPVTVTKDKKGRIKSVRVDFF